MAFNPGPPTDSTAALAQLWRRYRGARRQHRRTFRELAAARRRLGELFAIEHARLSTPGCLGQFHRWLRDHHIPRASAYLLMDNHRRRLNPNLPRPLKPMRPLCEVRGSTLHLRLDRGQREHFRHCIEVLTTPPRRLRFTELLLQTLLECVPAPLRKPISDHWAQAAYAFDEAHRPPRPYNPGGVNLMDWPYKPGQH